jgi:hypothetical protein
MMKALKLITLGMWVPLLLICVHRSYPQMTPKTHEECMKLVPGDWGPNFGREWRGNEAIYWGCRLGVPVARVQAWQQAAGVVGWVEDLIPVTIGKQRLVLVEEGEGSAHCFRFTALEESAAGWKVVWTRPTSADPPEGMEYCTLSCPAVKMQARGKTLILRTTSPANPGEDPTLGCKNPVWKREAFRWNERSYQPVQAKPGRPEAP